MQAGNCVHQEASESCHSGRRWWGFLSVLCACWCTQCTVGDTQATVAHPTAIWTAAGDASNAWLRYGTSTGVNYAVFFCRDACHGIRAGTRARPTLTSSNMLSTVFFLKGVICMIPKSFSVGPVSAYSLRFFWGLSRTLNSNGPSKPDWPIGKCGLCRAGITALPSPDGAKEAAEAGYQSAVDLPQVGIVCPPRMSQGALCRGDPKRRRVLGFWQGPTPSSHIFPFGLKGGASYLLQVNGITGFDDQKLLVNNMTWKINKQFKGKENNKQENKSK